MMGYDLERFITAQDPVYEQVVEEISNGQKTGHWMWFIFPQIRGLGKSYMSEKFSLSGIGEARAYLEHPVLGKRLILLSKQLLRHSDKSIVSILGRPDHLKLKSSMTLFEAASNDEVFAEVLETFYDGGRCRRSLVYLK